MFCVGLTVFLIAVCNIGIISGATTKRSPDDSPIKYPGPLKEFDMNRYGRPGDDRVPESCRGHNFCTVKPKNYPQEHFNKLFKGTKPAMVAAQVLPDDISLDNRQGDPADNDNCESIISYEPLYQVREKRNENWRTVVQAPNENFIQRIRLETCVNVEAACFTVFASVPGYITHCKQKYSNWEVLVSDGKNGTEKITAELPTCCSCHYKITNIEDRFGKPKS